MSKHQRLQTHQSPALKTYVRMMRAVDAVTVKIHKHLTRHNLTISQFGVLEALYSLGLLCQKEISQKILKSDGNMTMVIDNLEKRHLVKRERDEHDRRKFMVRLTDEGYALIDEIFPVHAEVTQQVFSVLSPEELDELGRLLGVLGKAAAS
jgi:MarR family 2-MHQ and catechol resistance regulon transcriptional repressor